MIRLGLIAAFVALLSLAGAQAQSPVLPGPGLTVASGVAYTGPLDANPTSVKVWWGLQCATNAYAGNVIDITDSATGNTTGTRLQCSTGGVISAVVSASACATTTGGGTFVTGGACSPLATTCATACRALALYDQSGVNACNAGAGPCDVISASLATSPTFVQNCLNTTLPCLQTVRASNMLMSSKTQLPAFAQPFTISFVAGRTGSFTNFQTLMGDNATAIQSGWNSSANTMFMTAGNAPTFSNAACNDSTVRAFTEVYNTTTSAIVCGTTASGALNVGTSGWSNQDVVLFSYATATNPVTVSFATIGMWAASWSSTQWTAQHSNAVGYWGIP